MRGRPPVLTMWKWSLRDTEPLPRLALLFTTLRGLGIMPAHRVAVLGLKLGLLTPDADHSSRHASPLDAQPMSSGLLVSWVPSGIQQPYL